MKLKRTKQSAQKKVQFFFLIEMLIYLNTDSVLLAGFFQLANQKHEIFINYWYKMFKVQTGSADNFRAAVINASDPSDVL